MARQDSGRRIEPGCCTWCAHHHPYDGRACPQMGCRCNRHHYVKDTLV